MRWIALLLVAAGAAACDGESVVEGAPLGWGPASGPLYSPPAGAAGGIIGDWAYCDPDTEGCEPLETSGLRFGADGTYSRLWMVWNTAGTTYCVDEVIGRYSWDGTTLTLYDIPDVGDMSCAATLNADLARLECMLGHPLYLVRLSGELEPCSVFADVPGG
jgi:hypothetical protein